MAPGAILYGLAFPPHDQAWAAWVALVPLLLAVRGRRTREAFAFGAAYGFACSTTVAGWLATTMVRFFELSPVLGRLVAAAYGVAFWGTAFGCFAAGAARLLAARGTAAPAIAVAALWTATELLRGRMLAQPWALLGYSQHADVALIQLASVTAVYGLSFLVALGNVAVAQALELLWTGHRRGALRPLGLPAALVALAWIGGRLALPPLRRDGPLPVAVVQSNVPPAVRWTRAYTDRQIAAHTRLTDGAAALTRGGLIVWPENAVPRYLETEPGLAVLLAGLARRLDSDLLFGAPRHADGRSFNSVRLITAAGRNGGHYDKQRLVLFAEANPLRPAAVAAPEENPTRFTAGRDPGVLHGAARFGVSVCHEVLFPDLAMRAVAAGAEVLVNVSNDGWLDPATGVAGRQHAAMAAFRAVETRRYLVRAATTGISAVTDPYGRVLDALPPDASGVLEARVAPRRDRTLYVRLGDAFALGCAVIAALALARARGRAGLRTPRAAPIAAPGRAGW